MSFEYQGEMYEDDICEDQDEVVAPKILAAYIRHHCIEVFSFNEKHIEVESMYDEEGKHDFIPADRKSVRDWLGY